MFPVVPSTILCFQVGFIFISYKIKTTPCTKQYSNKFMTQTSFRWVLSKHCLSVVLSSFRMCHTTGICNQIGNLLNISSSIVYCVSCKLQKHKRSELERKLLESPDYRLPFKLESKQRNKQYTKIWILYAFLTSVVFTFQRINVVSLSKCKYQIV